MNLVVLLEMAAEGFGGRVAVQRGDERLRYDELFRAAGAAAAEIAASGAAHAALLDETSPALPLQLFASAWAGVPFAPLSYRQTDAELDGLLARLAPVHLVAGAERAAGLAGRTPGAVVVREDLLARARAAGARAADWKTDPEAIAVLLFTSGTTGGPKAALLRHRNLVSYILDSVEFGSAGEDEASLVSVPPYHIAGIAAVLSAVYAGRRIVQLPVFDADAWLALARAEGVSHAFVVPTMLARIVAALERDGRASADLPRLRSLAYGGGRMPLPVVEKAMRLFPQTDFTNAYGLTETSSTICVLGPDDHRAAAGSSDPERRRRLASVGRPLPSVEVEVRDADGRVCAPGARGEIRVRGEQVSGEYLGRTGGLGDDGWFATRDAGWLDAEGYLFLEGRIDDVIVRGGENLSPGEIEDALCAHEAVADAAVVGVPDRQWGEGVAAAVVLAPGRRASEAELRDWVRDRLRSSRTPDRIAFRSELPYNETGKLLRRRVREELAGGS